MKLGDQHSCDTFATKGQEPLDMSTMALARDITVRCRTMMDEGITRIVSLVHILAESMHHEGPAERPPSISPFTLHCVYRAMAAQAWMGSATSLDNMDKYADGQARCKGMLEQVDKRWKVAGKFITNPFVFWT